METQVNGEVVREWWRAVMCPECGLGYGREEIVLYGWGQTGMTARKPKLIIFGTVLILYGVLRPVFQWITGLGAFPEFRFKVLFGLLRQISWPGWFYFVASSALYVGVVIWAVLRRRRYLRTMPAPLQMRLSRAGFAMREGIGRVKVRAWKRAMGVEMKKLSEGRQRLFLRRNRKFLKLSIDSTRSIALDIQDEVAAEILKRVEGWRVLASSTHGEP